MKQRLKITAWGSLLLLTVACNNNQKTSKTVQSDSTTTTVTDTVKKDTVLPGTHPGTKFTEAYIQSVARFAYVWAWPMVNSFNRRVALTSVKEPGLRGGVLPNAPQGSIAMLTD